MVSTSYTICGRDYGVVRQLPTKPTRFVIGVLSFDGVLRGAVRREWANMCPYQVYFLVGKVDGVWPLAEYAAHHDMLLVDVEEGYRTALTIKSLAFLCVAHELGAAFALKTDDDAYVHTERLEAFACDTDPRRHALYKGHVWRDAPVVREPGHPHLVSRAQHAPARFPPYCSGAGYLLSTAALAAAVPRIPTHTFVPPEDACVGILMHAAGVAAVHSAAVRPFHELARPPIAPTTVIQHDLKGLDELGAYARAARRTRAIQGLPKIYWINLERSADRREFFAAQMDALGLTHARVEAIDGTEAAASDRVVFAPHPNDLRDGELGCALSHIKALQAFLDDGDELGVVAEDDTSLHTLESWGFSFAEFLAALPEDWRVVQLCLTTADPARVGLHRRCPDDWSTGMYVLGRETAQILVDRHTATSTGQYRMGTTPRGVADRIIYHDVGTVYTAALVVPDVTFESTLASDLTQHLTAWHIVQRFWRRPRTLAEVVASRFARTDQSDPASRLCPTCNLR